MNIDQKTVIYAQVNSSNLSFKKLLEEDRVLAIRAMTQATDTALIYRAQGKVQLLDDMIAKLEESHKYLRKG